MLSLQDRVNRGVDLLDMTRPSWYNEIDLATLDIGCGAKCICGQLYGGFGAGLAHLLDINTMWDDKFWQSASDYGFFLTRGELNDGGFVAIEELTSLWKEVIIQKTSKVEEGELCLV